MCWIFISENIFETFGTEYQRQISVYVLFVQGQTFQWTQTLYHDIQPNSSPLHHCTSRNRSQIQQINTFRRLTSVSESTRSHRNRPIGPFHFPSYIFPPFSGVCFFFWPLRWRTAVGKFPPENSELSVFDRLYIFIYMWLCIFLCLCSSFTDLVDASWSAASTSYQLANWRHS